MLKCIWIIQDPAKILSVDHYSSSTVFIGDNIELFCNAEGNPTPQYTWIQSTGYNSSEKLITRGISPTLLIQASSYDYEGTYTCQIENFVNDSIRNDSKPIHITVEGI